MSNKLGVITIIGLTVSVVSLASAAVIANFQSDNDFDIPNMGWNDKSRCRFDQSQKTGTRDLAWDGTKEATISLPATASYRPGSGDRLTVSGNTDLLTHVRLRDGRVELDCSLRGGSDQLIVTLPGTEFTAFTIEGTANLTLEQINQRDLDLTVEGSGRIDAAGTAEDLDISVEGSGKANLDKLFAKRVDLDIEGSGEAGIAPEESADVSISGTGRVKLNSAGKNLKTLDVSMEGAGNIEGSGNADMLKVSIEGSGDVRLSQFSVKEAHISIEGSGDAEIAPKDRADINISGSGDVRLLSQPKVLNSEVEGSGRVSQTGMQP